MHDAMSIRDSASDSVDDVDDGDGDRIDDSHPTSEIGWSNDRELVTTRSQRGLHAHTHTHTHRRTRIQTYTHIHTNTQTDKQNVHTRVRA